LQIDSMEDRGRSAPTYRWDTEEPSTKVHVEFTEANMAGLFDDLYDAAWIEGAPRKKPFYKGRDAKTCSCSTTLRLLPR
jgi:hypothetical protein